jgi:hypothetical protein
MLRKLPPGEIGIMPGRNPAYVPVGELGWLSPIRPASSGGGYYLFRCRCGAQVSRIGRHVRKSVERGTVPKCSPECTGVKAEIATP